LCFDWIYSVPVRAEEILASQKRLYSMQLFSRLRGDYCFLLHFWEEGTYSVCLYLVGLMDKSSSPT